MVSKVALVELGQEPKRSFKQALELIGKIKDLNTIQRSVVVKVGVFDPKTDHHATVGVVDAIIDNFNEAPKVFLAESDNYRGTGSEKLKKWKTLFSERVVPFNLSQDKDIKQIKVADEKIGLSHILFKPNVLVSTHILRVYKNGSIIKNLLGLTPDRKKARYHQMGLEKVILDIYEAVGGIDLAVLDGTHIFLGVTPRAAKINANVLIVGRDAVAVEAVGASIVGMDPKKMPIIQEAISRGLGEGNLEKIEVLGTPIQSLKERFKPLLKGAKTARAACAVDVCNGSTKTRFGIQKV